MEAVKKGKKGKEYALKNLKKEFEEGRVVLGFKRTLKLLKKNKIEKVYISSTPPEAVSQLQQAKIEKINLNSLELGKYLGKSFPVAVIGVMKNENVR